MTELLPCPFCGTPAHLRDWGGIEQNGKHYDKWAAGCMAEGCLLECYAISHDKDGSEAATAWNRRA